MSTLSFLCRDLLAPLQNVIGLIEKKQTMPILSNVLISTQGQQLSVTGTNVEMTIRCDAAVSFNNETIEFTAPAQKLLDICRALPEEMELAIQVSEGALRITAGSSRFSLLTLPASEFPKTEKETPLFELTISQAALRNLVQKTFFAMAQDEVRYNLNGLFIEISGKEIKAAATDGHRLTLNHEPFQNPEKYNTNFILPRKSVLELLKVVGNNDAPINIALSNNHFTATHETLSLTSKLVEARFPNYQSAIPAKNDKTARVNKMVLKQALRRAAILSNEKSPAIYLSFSNNSLQIESNNAENELAEETFAIDFELKKDKITLCLNAYYLTEAIDNIDSESLVIRLSDEKTAIIIENDDQKSNNICVIMPMVL